MSFIDLTRTFFQEMPAFPGDDLPRLKGDFDPENEIVHFHLSTGMHVGTHMDGPLHMIPSGRKLSEIEIEKFFANGCLIDARGRDEIGVDLLEGKNISEGDCVLIYTGFDQKFGDPSFYSDYPVLTEKFAKKLVDLNVKFVGMDTPSPDIAPYSVHRILLGAEVLIIENLTNLEQLLSCKKFEVFALPAKFDAEAAPVRVIAKVRET